MINTDLYEILGVSTDASVDEIKKKFRALQLKQHPDKDRNTINRENYMKICEAYEILSNPQKRAYYDHNRLFPTALQNTIIMFCVLPHATIRLRYIQV